MALEGKQGGRWIPFRLRFSFSGKPSCNFFLQTELTCEGNTSTLHTDCRALFLNGLLDFMARLSFLGQNLSYLPWKKNKHVILDYRGVP